MASGVKAAQSGGCASLFRCWACSDPAADLYKEPPRRPSLTDQHFHIPSNHSLTLSNKLCSDQPLPLDSLSASPFGQAQIQQANRLAHYTTPLEIPPSALSSPASYTPTGPTSAPSGCHLAPTRSQPLAISPPQPLSACQTPKSKNLRPLQHQPGSASRAKGTALSTPLNVLDAPPVDESDSVMGDFSVRKSCLSHATMELQLPRLPRLQPSTSGSHDDDFEKAPVTPTASEVSNAARRHRSRSINSSKYLHKMPSLRHLQDKADALYRHSLHESASMGSLKSAGSVSGLRGSSLDGATNPSIIRPNTPPARLSISGHGQKINPCSQLAGTSSSQISGCSPRDSGASRMSGMVRRGASPSSTFSMLPDLGGTSGGSELESLHTRASSPAPDDTDLPALGSGREMIPLKVPSASLDVGDWQAQPQSPGSRDACPPSPGMAYKRSSCRSPRSKSDGRSRLRRSASHLHNPSNTEHKVDETEEEWFALLQACSKLTEAQDEKGGESELDPAQAAAHVRLAASLAGVPDCVPQGLPSPGQRSIHV